MTKLKKAYRTQYHRTFTPLVPGSIQKEGIEQQNTRKRGEHLSCAVAIISTLLTFLDSNVTDEPITFLRGLYQAMLIELGKVAVTHDVNTLDLAFRYLEHLKHIWEHDVMGLPCHALEKGQQGTQPVAASAAASPEVAPRPVYSPASLGGSPRLLCKTCRARCSGVGGLVTSAASPVRLIYTHGIPNAGRAARHFASHGAA
jgi:flagellar protein FliS